MGTVLRSVVFRVAAAVVGFAALAGVSASCLDTSGLAGGAEPVVDSGPVEDTAPVNPNPCGKDLQNDLANCGTCGNVCGFGANSFPLCTAGACKIGCNTNFGNCDNDDKNGCEDALAGDPKNCSACGRDCGGGSCMTGQCGPVNLAPKVDAGLADGYPVAMALDATSIFYAWYNTVGTYDLVKLDKATGVPVVLASGPGYPSQFTYFTVDSDPNGFVYYPRVLTTYFPVGMPPYTSADGAIMKLSKTSPDGGLQTPTMVTGVPQGAAGGQFIDGNTRIVVTAAGIYYSLYGYSAVTGSGVFKCPLTGACAAPAQLAPNQYGAYSLSVDATSFAFNNLQTQTVITCPIVGCPAMPTQLAATTNARLLFEDAANYYWINQNNASIVKMDKATSTATPLASGQPSPYSLAVDEKTVFWVGTNNPATIASCPIAGCAGSPTPLVPNLTAVRGLAVDDKALYWFTQTTGGSIFKVVK